MTPNYLSKIHLSELIGCKPNQRRAMQEWLKSNNWKFELDKTGLPKVATAYHDRKMGITENISKDKYEEIPNLDAFKERKDRR